ncbi:hypothetical protein [Epilithonimonas caeni]|uniref:hypothetical protein n=1 Tax=Epilithonimonas caeni TaxID=365343 RepID=UPI0003FFCBE0|nr:hypothetical protein [Epilithonimonas caeni]
MAIYVSSYDVDYLALASALTNTLDKRVVVDIDLNNHVVTASDDGTIMIFEHGELSNGKFR